VPSADPARLGYPVSVQLYFRKPREAVRLALELFAGSKDRPEPVEGFFTSPDAPLQIEHVPLNAWAVIPKSPLAARTRYTARARWLDQEREWSFTTGN
jgi:hypothetical protein